MQNNDTKLWGIDLGGTKIEGVVLESKANQKVILRKRVPTLGDQGYEKVISQVALLIDQMSAELGERPTQIGLGTPGRLDKITQTIKNSNSVCLNGQPFKQDLETALKATIKIENDANCFALSEANHLRKNEFENAEVIFGIILGTGVGGGLIVNGSLVSGVHGIAGEWGHNYLDASGGPCYCGKEGCTETLISGPALEKYHLEKFGVKTSLKNIVESYRAGDDNARQTMDRLFYFFGKGMAQIINVLDPNVIVIGGGVGNIDELYTKGAESVKEFLFNPRLNTQFVKPKFGDSSGVFGAALL